MLSIFDSFRDLTTASIALRMVLAVICSGLIGMEREFKRRPAGFRTHILICLGAAMTTLTSQYLLLVQHYYTDIARIGAQVVAGISFIGAGTIIVTRQQRVKGLTTAAGLWASAIMGLAFGAGFIEGGLIVTVMILFAERFFSKLEFRLLESAPEVTLFIEYATKQALDDILILVQGKGLKIIDMQVTRTNTNNKKKDSSVIFTVRLDKKRCTAEQLIEDISKTEGILSVDEL
ncbi:MAG: MgtC/SapB family protein [Lachnospiraceae bacterium]|nr:MgtC/SapB family protein [Lachnospiraceae bacterium]